MPPALALLRPKQWIKNFFVFAPLLFSQHLFEGGNLLPVLRTFAAFCFMASAIYVLNDIRDKESDAHHPKKRNRPIAAGTISIPVGIAELVVCLCLAAGFAYDLPVKVIIALTLYAIINVAYSAVLKHVVLVDVFCIAAGFMLRVVAGAYAIEVQVSQWLILCALFLSLLLAIAKRRSELKLKDEGKETKTRAVLESYTVSIIDQMTTISASGVVISYALYTVAERTVKVFGTENLVYTTIFVLYGVFRYLYLEHKERLGESPTDVVTSDIPLIINMVLWVASIVGIIYIKNI